MLAQPRLVAVTLLAILLSGCASWNPTHEKPILTAAASGGVASSKALPPDWTTAYWGLAASVRCDADDAPLNVGITDRSQAQTYTLPKADALATAATLHLSVAWNVSLPIQSIHYGLNGLVKGSSASGAGEVRIAASQLKPGAAYPFYACAEAPTPVLLNPLVADEIVARVWYS